MTYDVIIVGAGPAGLLAGCILEENGINIKIIEKGNDYLNRNKQVPFDVSYGFGGAGLFSDGKLSYPPAASKLWTGLKTDVLKKSYEYIKDLFESIGIELKNWDYTWTKPAVFETEKEYESTYLLENERNILLKHIFSKLAKRVIFNVTVNNISKQENVYKIECSHEKQYYAKKIIIATGKSSSLKLFSKEINIVSKFYAEMGVRLEIDNQFFMPNNKKQIDYKIIEKIDETTERRTFCCCKNGMIIESLFDDHITYNGEMEEKATGYSNIGIVVRTLDANSQYAREMGECIKTSGNITTNLKRFAKKDFIIGENVDPLLKNLAKQLVIDEQSGKIYGPEIEKYGDYPVLNKNLCQNDLYFIGDSTGIFRGLMAAFVSGAYVGLLITEMKKLSMKEYMHQLRIKQSDTQEMKLVFTAQSKEVFYCRDVICQYVLEKGMLPINPFRVFDYFLSDRVDREIIRRGNNQLIRKCEELWVFGKIADGVLFEIASAIEQSKKIRFFTVGTKIEEIREISVEQISFEPEVHAHKIKKADLIDFIKNTDINDTDKDKQMSIFDYIEGNT